MGNRTEVSYPEPPKREMKESSSNTRFILAYILLVGFPLLGLAGVLKAGRSLSAPLAVDGVWKLDAVTAQQETQICIQPLAALDSLLTISQSGRELGLTLNKQATATGAGMIEGAELSATFQLPKSSPEGCGDSLVLNARIESKAVPKLMSGTISFRECASCTTERFHAGMQSRAGNSEAH
jgi:hypothetical protein